MNRTQLVCIWLACCLFFSSFVMAATEILNSKVFLVVLLKALNYDRKIDRLAEGKIVIGILYMNGDDQARGFAEQIKNDSLEIQSTVQLKGLPTEFKVLSFDKTFDKKTLEDQLKQNHISAIVLANQDPDSNKIIFETARAVSIDSICYSLECVKQGGGLGIVPRNNRTQLLVNLAAVGQEGSDYSGQLLGICEAVK